MVPLFPHTNGEFLPYSAERLRRLCFLCLRYVTRESLLCADTAADFPQDAFEVARCGLKRVGVYR